jgi:hypothetical protein
MEYITINEEQKPFRFSLRGLKRLEAATGKELFNNIMNGKESSFGDTILLAERVLFIGLSEGAKRTKEEFTYKVEQIEEIVDDGGMPFLEEIMGLFEKCITSPK